MSHRLNFLHEQEPASHAPVHHARQASPSSRRARVIGLIVVVLLAGTVFIGVSVAQVFTGAVAGRDALFSARAKAEVLDFEGAAADVERAQSMFERAERGTVVLTPFTIIPFLGPHIEAANIAAHTGATLSASLKNILEIGADVVRLAGLTRENLFTLAEGADPGMKFGDLPGETKRAILARLAASAGDFEVLAARIHIAREEFDRLPQDELFGPVKTALAPFSRQLGEAESLVTLVANTARILPQFAGLDGRSEQLLLFLNNNELRPGGGFIGSFGELAMQYGDIAALETFDVYALDDRAQASVKLVPPPAITRYLSSSKWLFRDSNWWPDFAMSARFGVERYRAEYTAVHGKDRAVSSVIAVTPTFVSDLLAITGPIEVRGQTFRPENVADLLEYQVGFGFVKEGIPLAQRKEILADLVSALKDKLYALPLASWTRVADVTERAITRKQFMLWSADPRTQSAIETAHWGARVSPVAGHDLQLVADANLASLKSDPDVKRSMKYEIFRNTSKQWIGRTTIRYVHNGTFDFKTTRYRTFMRLYVPAGSQFVRATGTLADDKLKNPSKAPGTVDIGSEMGLTVFGAFTSVEPGETRDVSFEYVLAPSVVSAIEAGGYKLDVLKQPGARERGLTLHLDFDKNLTGASPGEDRNAWGDDIYELTTSFDTDRSFEADL